jgi:solute:Na+ symporter, SSS family
METRFMTLDGIVVATYFITDLIQTIILIIGALVCAVLMVVGLPEGPGQLFEIAAEHDKFSLGSFSANLTESTFWVVLIYGFVINVQNFGVDQNYVQRYHAAKSDAEARKSLWLGGLVYVPISAVFYFIGTALFAYYSVRPEVLPIEYRAPEKSDSVFPFFIVTSLPPGVVGLLIASIFAATMSTISSSLNSSATIVLNDFYQRYVRPGAGERQKMVVLHGATAAVGLLGTAMALGMISVKIALDAWWMLAGVFGGGMLGLFLLGFLSRRATNRAAVAGVVAGVLVILWLSLSPGWDGALAPFSSPFHGLLTIVFGTAVLLVVGLLAVHFTRPPRSADSNAARVTQKPRDMATRSLP